MNMSYVHTIKSKDYDYLRCTLDDSDLEQDVKALMQEVLNEHKLVTIAAFKKRKQQIDDATGLFAALENGNRLFPEPTPDCEPEKPESGDAVDPLAPIVRDKKPRKKPVKKILHPLELSQLTCPCCKKKMHKAHKKTMTIIRIEGFSCEKHELQTARCLTCNTTAEAPGPQEKTIHQFAIPAASVLIGLRYAYGMPSYRLEEVSASMGYEIPDSSQWSVFLAAAGKLTAFHKFLQNEAANAGVVQIDDTKVRITETTIALALAKLEGRPPERTGVHTTGFLAKCSQGKICLFQSGLHHAGEFLENVLEAKSTEDQVILMSDAGSSNASKLSNVGADVVQANCNSHAVRRFDELSENPVFENDVNEILKLYKAIFVRDRALKETAAAHRLAVHKQESLPQMHSIKNKINTDFLNKRVEPNSELGRAYQYFLNHFDKLCAFCTIANAPICNNACERLLKRAIRHRKNSLFYKTETGAAVGDVHMSILMTAKENGLEPVQYMTDLLTHTDKVNKNPDDWLPWNYTKTIKALEPDLSPPTN
jgi:transposase